MRSRIVAVLGTGVIDANFIWVETLEVAIDFIEQAGGGPQKTAAPRRWTTPVISPFLLQCCGVYPELQRYEIL